MQNCNWLNEQEGIPTDQWCYEPNKRGKYEAGMTMPPDFLQRTGYRLPTEAEWEYACRSGTDTGFSLGDSEELLGKYCWFNSNTLGKSHPVGALRPNDLGLFDMHGNLYEWCEDVYRSDDGKLEVGQEEDLLVDDHDYRVLRGGSFGLLSSFVRSASRGFNKPMTQFNTSGFRLARTLPVYPEASSPDSPASAE